MSSPRVLFICKHRSLVYGEPGDYGVNTASGLRTSVGLLSDMLWGLGVRNWEVDVIDNNCIDRAVTKYQPTHVIIEALWVVPEKFDALKKLHPDVKWIVRLHSELPFLAIESVAMDWIAGYIRRGVFVGCNSDRLYRDLSALYTSRHMILLPNYYPLSKPTIWQSSLWDDSVHVGCFGAIRILKNHLTQAVAAIEFARTIGKTLFFHVNVGRTDREATPTLKNLRALFETAPNARLAEHQWMAHSEFVDLVSFMDIGMQVSFSETFNIVTADMVNAGVPVVVSPEVSWCSSHTQADPTSADDITQTLLNVWRYRKVRLHQLNRLGLSRYNKASRDRWEVYLLGHCPQELRKYIGR